MVSHCQTFLFYSEGTNPASTGSQTSSIQACEFLLLKGTWFVVLCYGSARKLTPKCIVHCLDHTLPPVANCWYSQAPGLRLVRALKGTDTTSLRWSVKSIKLFLKQSSPFTNLLKVQHKSETKKNRCSLIWRTYAIMILQLPFYPHVAM